MKRMIALFMFFILLLSFTACSSKEETIVSSTIEESQESTAVNSTAKPADQDKPSGGLQDHSSLP